MRKRKTSVNNDTSTHAHTPRHSINKPKTVNRNTNGITKSKQKHLFPVKTSCKRLQNTVVVIQQVEKPTTVFVKQEVQSRGRDCFSSAKERKLHRPEAEKNAFCSHESLPADVTTLARSWNYSV